MAAICPLCDNTLYLNTLTGDPTCARCCPPVAGDHLVLITLVQPEPVS